VAGELSTVLAATRWHCLSRWVTQCRYGLGVQFASSSQWDGCHDDEDIRPARRVACAAACTSSEKSMRARFQCAGMRV